MNPNQFFDLSRERLDDLSCFRAVLADGQLFRYVDGDRAPANDLIECWAADHFSQESAVAVANGTVGLRLGLLAVGVKPGDWVALSAYSFIACAMAVASIGAIPVPIDMDTALTIDASVLDRHNGTFAAVLIVHVQGHAIPVERIRRLCDDRNIPLIEDVCQALGASSTDGRAGQLADVTVTSFQQAKQISCGEGGLVAGSADAIECVMRMADLGAVRRNGVPDWDDERAVIGENLRLTELQAALVMDQAGMLEDTLVRQREHRAELRQRIGPGVAVVDSSHPPGDTGSHTLFLARTPADAQQFCAAMRDAGTLARIVWAKTYLEHGLFRRSFAEHVPADIWPHRAAALAPRIISVPLSKYATEADIDRVAQAVRNNRRHIAPGEIAYDA